MCVCVCVVAVMFIFFLICVLLFGEMFFVSLFYSFGMFNFILDSPTVCN